ncbi:MAG: ABC transporter ATP-binding protein [Brooklawnia sp.]|uniref:ABC transporter ATP-binding protein n=1 Tax=Brooklawnia sp. TaxID=2699740 RepID=UPI003C766DF9
MDRILAPGIVMVMEIIQVRNLRKSYGRRTVLHGIDLSITEGEVFGILGPNGAGKTTTVEIIGGLRSRDDGEVTVAGIDPATETRELRRLVGIQLQEARQPAKITVREALNLYRSFYRNPFGTDELMARFGLTEQANTRFENLSGGQQQRLSVALALVGRPRIAILDELTTGLDPAARREIWRFLGDLTADGVTILLVTHSMEEAQFLCDRVAVITDGRISALGSPDKLAAGQGRTLVTFSTAHTDRLTGLGDLPSVMEVAVDGSRVSVLGAEASPTDVLGYLMTHGVTPEQLRVSTPTLDDAYLALTKKEVDR